MSLIITHHSRHYNLHFYQNQLNRKRKEKEQEKKKEWKEEKKKEKEDTQKGWLRRMLWSKCIYLDSKRLWWKSSEGTSKQTNLHIQNNNNYYKIII